MMRRSRKSEETLTSCMDETRPLIVSVLHVLLDVTNRVWNDLMGSEGCRRAGGRAEPETGFDQVLNKTLCHMLCGKRSREFRKARRNHG